MVPTLMEELGNDWVISAGGAVRGYPDGAVAGGKALRQAVDCYMKGVDYKDISAAECPELAKAIEFWGIYSPERDKELFDLK
jgi:ribulose 1,5-bisphosphate carboxylase large subunit-like protein